MVPTGHAPGARPAAAIRCLTPLLRSGWDMRGYALRVRIFLGVTGASGAPYAEGLLRALAAAECEIGLAASRSGLEVLATELYGDPSLPREEVLERFVGDAGSRVTVYG